MSDKDRFTFDDNDDFPEADLSSAFSDGEFEADNPAPDVEQEPVQKPGKKKRAAKDSSGSGGSRTRILLIVLLLVVAAGAGAYYFMGLGATTPVVPTVAAPAKKAQKTVALPPQPAKPVTVAVPPRPAPPAAAEPAKPAVAEPAKPAVAEPAKPAPVQDTAAVKTAPAPVDQAGAKPAQPAPAEPAKPVAAATQPSTAAASPAVQAKPAQPVAKAAPRPAPSPVPVQQAGGAFMLDAGSYLFEANRDALLAKIKKLGYESLVTPVDARLDMTRLRIGTYSKEDVREALDFARSIEPGAYSAPAGDGFVIYAGTFLKQGTVDRLTKRFQSEGIKVRPEPVQVVRTLNRIRFGSFKTREDAVAAANVVNQQGVKAVVVKAR